MQSLLQISSFHDVIRFGGPQRFVEFEGHELTRVVQIEYNERPQCDAVSMRDVRRERGLSEGRAKGSITLAVFEIKIVLDDLQNWVFRMLR